MTRTLSSMKSQNNCQGSATEPKLYTEIHLAVLEILKKNLGMPNLVLADFDWISAD